MAKSSRVKWVLTLLAVLCVAQAPLKVKVALIDVSAPDEVYEDESRALADDAVTVLNKSGFFAERVDERELPREGCRIGPCLGKVSLQRGAQVVVALDATELPDKRIGVSMTAMRSTDGLPLAAVRYVATLAGKPAKELTAFAKDLLKNAVKALTVPDAGGQAHGDGGVAPTKL